jgi:hypothetical protein
MPKPSRQIQRNPKVDREALAVEALNQFDELVANSKIKLAAKVSQFLSAGVVIGEPLYHPEQGVGVSISNDPKMSRLINIIPLAKSDDALGSAPEYYLSRHGKHLGFGFFYESLNAIFLNCQAKLSSPWLGLVLAHESLHAMYLKQGTYRGQDYQDAGYWDEEVDAFELEIGLLAEVSGAAFSSAVTKTVKKIKPKAVLSQDKTDIPAIPYDRSLDKLFGAPASTLESQLRSTVFAIAVAFKLLEQAYGKEAQVDKRLYMRALAINDR